MLVAIAGGVLLLLAAATDRLRPILQLAHIAQKISQSRDYSTRVEKFANDELGTLYDEFNAMLDQIQRSERELQQAHGQLEIRVEERTRELSQANLQLSKEIGERKRAEAELEAVHQQLVDAAARPAWPKSPPACCTTSATCSTASMSRPPWSPIACGTRSSANSPGPWT